MALWKWVTGRLNVTKDWAKWRQIFGYDDDSGERITEDAALKLSTWWSGTRLITETIATLPFGLFQKSENGDRAPIAHPLNELLGFAPNADQTAVEFWEGRIGPVCTVGNSYAEKRFIGDRLVSLEPLKIGQCEPFREEKTNRLMYRVTDRGKTEEMPPDKIFHIRGFGMDGDEGLSPVAYAARSLGGALAAERAAARVYRQGLRASGFWKAPATMNPEQRAEFEKNYIKPGEGLQGQGKSIIMPPGFDWGSFNITPRDAELLMARGFNVADLCRWLGIPPILLGHAQDGQTMWGSGVEQIILGWLVLGLRAYLKRVESAVNRRLLTRSDWANGIFFEFNFEGLLRADSQGRAALMATFAQNGLRNRDELRKLDNYPAMPGGDVFTVQSNLLPIDKLGAQQQDANTVRNALRAWLIEEREQERKAA